MRTKFYFERGADERQPCHWHLAIGKEFKLLSLVWTPIALAEADADAVEIVVGSGWPVWFRPILLLEAVEFLRVCTVEGGRNKTGRGGAGEG
jgi:hypothetical protein